MGKDRLNKLVNETKKEFHEINLSVDDFLNINSKNIAKLVKGKNGKKISRVVLIIASKKRKKKMKGGENGNG